MATPIVPWVGGKRRLAKTILAKFPEHTCYCELFAGAAALYFQREPAKVEVLNDINGDLIRLYRVVQRHLGEFVRQFQWALTSRELFKWLQDTPPDTLTDIERAARFYYLQHHAFGGKVAGQNFGTSTTGRPVNLTRIEESLSAAYFRLAGTTIEHLNWSECVRRYDRSHTLFYADPPYWETEGYGVEFAWEEYERIAEALRTIKGRMVLSINDHPDIRALLRGFRTDTVSIDHQIGGGGKSTKRRELIVYSW